MPVGGLAIQQRKLILFRGIGALVPIQCQFPPPVASSDMKRAARSVLRKLGTDFNIEQERERRLEQDTEDARQRARPEDSRDDKGMSEIPEGLLTESEKRHEKYRRQQAMAGRVTPAAERLPIMTAEERQARDKDRPKWRATSFEGPIEKLIDKYGDLEEVQRHLTLGQSMKYEFTPDGRVLDMDGNVIYDGEKLVGPPK